MTSYWYLKNMISTARVHLSLDRVVRHRKPGPRLAVTSSQSKTRRVGAEEGSGRIKIPKPGGSFPENHTPSKTTYIGNWAIKAKVSWKQRKKNILPDVKQKKTETPSESETRSRQNPYQRAPRCFADYPPLGEVLDISVHKAQYSIAQRHATSHCTSSLLFMITKRVYNQNFTEGKANVRQASVEAMFALTL